MSNYEKYLSILSQSKAKAINSANHNTIVCDESTKPEGQPQTAV